MNSIALRVGVLTGFAALVPALLLIWMMGPRIDGIRTLSVGLAFACAILLSVIGWRIADHALTRIRNLTLAVRELSTGSFDVDFNATDGEDEFSILVRAVEFARNMLQVHQRGLKHRARSDRLTGLFNRGYLEQQLPLLEEWVISQDTCLTALLLDLDNFKQWNDALGHAAGDRVLETVGIYLQETCRQTDLVARLGGDEFVVIAPGIDIMVATNLGERLRQRIRSELQQLAREEFNLSDEQREKIGLRSITLSIGVAEYMGDREELLKNADAALYEAKRQGRDQVKVYNEAQAVA